MENELCPCTEETRAFLKLFWDLNQGVVTSLRSFFHVILDLLGVTKNGCYQVFDISEQLIFLIKT